jgi:hypothetical protein
VPIRKGAKLQLAQVSISNIFITEFQQRYPAKLEVYMDILDAFPEDDLGVLLLKPHSDGRLELLDGHHRYLAYIMKGRAFGLGLIVDESDISHEPSADDQGDRPTLRNIIPEATRVHVGRTGGSDPRASSVVRQTEAIKAVISTWDAPGAPQYYSDIQNELRNHWPALFNALNNLSNEFSQEQKQDERNR